MVFNSLNDMSATATTAGTSGGSFTNNTIKVKLSLNPQTRPVTIPSTSTITVIPTSGAQSPLPHTVPVPLRRTQLPPLNPADFSSVLGRLIRHCMRTFYELPKYLVVEYIYYYTEIKEADLAAKLHYDLKLLRPIIQELKRDKFIKERHRLEQSQKDGKNQAHNYYSLDEIMFVNVIKYRLLKIRSFIEDQERQQTYQQQYYKCQQCAHTYTELDIIKLFDASHEQLICYHCSGTVVEDGQTTTPTVQIANMILFNEQMKPLFDLLRLIDNIIEQRKEEQQQKHQEDGGAGNGNVGLGHRSLASSVYDSKSAMNHDIQIIIEDENEDDDENTNDIDDTQQRTNTKQRKNTLGKSSATGTSITTTETTRRTKSKKTAYEPKPLPHWFLRSTVYNDPNEITSVVSRSTVKSSQLQKQQQKSSTREEIKQMLMIYETKTNTRNKLQTQLSQPQISQQQQQITTSASSILGMMGRDDEDIAAAGLYHLLHDEEHNHMDIGLGDE